MPLLFQEDVSYYSNIGNEPEMAKKGLGSYLRWGMLIYVEYYNLRTLILYDFYEQTIYVNTSADIHGF